LPDKFGELNFLRGRDIGVLVFKKTGQKVGLANSLQVQKENPNATALSLARASEANFSNPASALNRFTGVGIIEKHPLKRWIVLDGKPCFFPLRFRGEKEDKGSYHRPPRDNS
jgi:hypothetical protein